MQTTAARHRPDPGPGSQQWACPQNEAVCSEREVLPFSGFSSRHVVSLANTNQRQALKCASEFSATEMALSSGARKCLSAGNRAAGTTASPRNHPGGRPFRARKRTALCVLVAGPLQALHSRSPLMTIPP